LGHLDIFPEANLPAANPVIDEFLHGSLPDGTR
jgi:hypothetical protein